MTPALWLLRSPRPARWLLAVYWPTLAIATHWPRLELAPSNEPIAGVSPDKVVHIAAFALLGLLAIASRLAGTRRHAAANLIVGTLIAGTYAALDEWTQQWAWVQRWYNPYDLVANVVGVLCAGGTVWIAQRRVIPLPRAVIVARVVLCIALPASLVMLLAPGFNAANSTMYRIAGLAQVRVDHLGHFIGGLALTLLLLIARPLGRVAMWVQVLVIAVLMLIAGPAGEYLQLLVTGDSTQGGRAWEWGDIHGHTAGTLAAVAIFVTWLGARLWRARRLARAQDAQRGHFVGHAILVSAMTFVSRITGLVRDAALGAAFGLGGITDAFMIGFIVPNLFRRLFGEGALTAAFIPVYAERLKNDPVMARRLASACVALLLIVLGIITLVGEGVLLWMHASRSWSPDTALAIRLTMVMLPYMPMVCIVALLGGMLQVHGRFGPPAAAPILLNVIMIGAIYFATDGVHGDARLREVIVIVAGSVVVAGAAQLAWQVLAILAHERPTLNFAGTAAPLRAVARTMGPMVIGLAVFQVNALADSLIAFGLTARPGGPATMNLFGYAVAYPIASSGAVTALTFAQRLYQFPLGVFGIALATAIFPALAHAAGDATDAGRASFARTLRHGLRLTVFIGLPASAGLILVRLPLVRVIFEHGDFRLADAQRVAVILTAYASAVWAYSLVHVITRAFYAKQDATTPLRIGVVMVVLNVVLNITLIWVLGAAGLAWSTAICAALQAVWLLAAAGRHVDRPIDGAVVLGWARTGAATLAMVAALVAVSLLVDQAAAAWSHSAGVLLVMVALGGGVYVLAAKLLGCDELRWLLHRQVGDDAR